MEACAGQSAGASRGAPLAAFAVAVRRKIRIVR